MASMKRYYHWTLGDIQARLAEVKAVIDRVERSGQSYSTSGMTMTRVEYQRLTDEYAALKDAEAYKQGNKRKRTVFKASSA